MAVNVSQLVGITGSPTNTAGGVNQNDIAFEQNRPFGERAYDLVTKAPPLVLASFVDTVGQSLGLVDENTLQNTLNEYLPTYGDYFQRNEEWIRIAGDITGMFIPGTIAMKGFQTGSYLLRGMKMGDNVLMKSLLHSGKSEDEILRGVRYFDRYLAQNRGVFAGRDFVNASYTRQGIGGLTQKLGRADFTRNAFVTNVSDTIKNATAFEMGVFATMNQSDVLYPDDFDAVDFAVLGGLGILLPGGIEYFITRSAIKSSMRSSMKNYGNQVIQEMSDIVDAATSGMFRGPTPEFPGAASRGDLISLYKVISDKERLALQNTGDGLLKTNFNSDIQEIDTIIKNQIGAGMGDKFPGWSGSKSFKDELVGSTILKALDDDPLLLSGLHTIEPVPPNKQEMNELLKSYDRSREKLKDLIKANEENNVFSEDEIHRLQILDNSHLVVVATDGSVISARDYTPRWLDTHTVSEIKVQRAKSDTPSIYYGLIETSPGSGEHRKIGVTADFQIVAPLPKTRTITQVINKEESLPPGYTRVIDPRNITRDAAENNMLNFLADNYQIGKGALYQKHIAPRLPDYVRNALHRFAAGDEMFRTGQVKKWLDQWTKEAQMIYDAHAEIRKALYDLRSEGVGALKLYRGESRKALQNPRSDIASYSSDPNVAVGFGEQLVERLVPIDDIVMIFGGLNKTDPSKGIKSTEREYIVRGNKNRILSTEKGVKQISVTQMLAEANETIENLGFNERSFLYGAFQKAIAQFSRSKTELFLTLDDHWTRWEAALQVFKSGDDAVKARIHFPQAIQGDLKNAEKLIMNKKLDELTSILGKQATAQKLGPAFVKGELSKDDMMYILNLPHGEFGDVHPLSSKLFEMATLQNAVFEESAAVAKGMPATGQFDKYAKASESYWKGLDDFMRDIQETQALPDIVAYKEAKDMAMRGHNFEPFDGKPALLFRRNLNRTDDYTRRAMVERATIRRTLILSKLMSPAAPALVRNTVQAILQNQQEFIASTRVDKLVEGSQNARGTISQRSFVAPDDTTIGPLNRVTSIDDRAIEENIARMFEPYVPIFNKLKSPNNRGSLESFNIAVQSLRYRWNVADEAAEPGIGEMLQLRLVNDASQSGKENRQKWKQFFGEDVKEGTALYLPVMVKGKNFGRPLGLTPDANAALLALTNLTSETLVNQNYIRRLVGLGELNKRPYYIPPIRLRGNESAYILHPDGSPKTFVVGRNQKDLQERIAQIRKEDDIVVTPETAERFFELEDRNFAGLIDYGADPILQTGKRPTGVLGSELLEIETGQIDSIIQTINDQLHSVAKRSRALVYEPQLNYAKAAKNASSIRGTTTPSIYDTYSQMVWGSQNLARTTPVGGVYGAIESFYDVALQGLFDKFNLLGSRGPGGAGGKANLNQRIFGEDKVFNQIKEQLGNYNPFKDTADFVEKTFRTPMPVSMKRDMAKLSTLTSTLTLRLFEAGHAVLNMTSLMATMPAVIKAMNRLPNEAEEEWANRIGNIAARFGADGKVPVFSPLRAITSAVHFMFSDEGREIWLEAARRGWLKQDVAEMMRTITAPKEGYAAGLISKYVNLMSTISDRSEEIARGIAFMTGYNLAKTTKILRDKENLLSFAHDFANKNIGDYRPTNRPQIFQGAVGMPLGLFQTFTWNYMQRLFGYIQNRQWRALATQYGMQSMVFGAKSVPGFDLFTEQFATNYDGSTDPVTALERALPQGVADLLLYGSISNIPKIWGSEGIALFTRGTVDPRAPTLLTPSQSPIANFVKETYNMFNESIDQFRQGGQFSTQRQMEIVGTYFINRPISNMFDILAGVSVDRRGQLINEDTQDIGSIAARLLGSKPLTEAKEEAAYRRQRNAEFARSEIRGRLNDSFRSMLRDGNLDEDNLSAALRDYYNSGGTPSGFAQWLRNAYVTANINRLDNKLREVMSSGKVEDVMRLLNTRRLVENDPSFAE